ncbi:uncharacterized [Tachysurus ichikawai]
MQITPHQAEQTLPSCLQDTASPLNLQTARNPIELLCSSHMIRLTDFPKMHNRDLLSSSDAKKNKQTKTTPQTSDDPEYDNKTRPVCFKWFKEISGKDFSLERV